MPPSLLAASISAGCLHACAAALPLLFHTHLPTLPDAHPRRQGRSYEAWQGLGNILLCVTGAEALYADMGHFNVRSIRVSPPAEAASCTSGFLNPRPRACNLFSFFHTSSSSGGSIRASLG